MNFIEYAAPHVMAYHRALCKLEAMLYNKEHTPYYILTQEQADRIRRLYDTPAGEPIRDIRPWSSISIEDATIACSIISPNTLGHPDASVLKVIISSKTVRVQYKYPPIKGEVANLPDGMKSSVSTIHFAHINDPLVWQFLLSQRYPVPMFIAPKHPRNGEDVLSLGLGIAFNS